MITSCKYCSNLFEVKEAEVKRGNGKFCSQSCATKFFFANKPKPIPNNRCAGCGVEFYRAPSKCDNRSKSGLYFCTRACKDNSQRLGGIVEIMPSHYGNADGKYAYRRIAFSVLKNECAVCGYNTYNEVLQVHHKDSNRHNNELSNLVILCPTHHVERHFIEKTGIYSKMGV